VLAETLAELRAYGDLLADMDEEYDDVALGFVLTGGRLLLTGALPTQAPDGTPCTLLADALGLIPGELVDGTLHYFPSVRAATWTTATAEVRVGVLQPLTLTDSSTVTHDVFATDTATGSPVGVEVRAGTGHAVVLTCDYPAHLPLWTCLLARLGATPRHTHDATTPGIVTTSTATPTGTRLLHALNVSPVDQSLTIRRGGTPLFDGAPSSSRPAPGGSSRSDPSDRTAPGLLQQGRPFRPGRLTYPPDRGRVVPMHHAAAPVPCPPPRRPNKFWNSPRSAHSALRIRRTNHPRNGDRRQCVMPERSRLVLSTRPAPLPTLVGAVALVLAATLSSPTYLFFCRDDNPMAITRHGWCT
jgi:hypothetical protein